MAAASGLVFERLLELKSRIEKKSRQEKRSQIGPPAAAIAQLPPASSRPPVLRRAVSPSRPTRQGCSAAVASVWPLGGSGSVSEDMKTRRAGKASVRSPPDKDKSHADDEG